MDLTDWENDIIYQHDCIYVNAFMNKETDPYQILSYCLTDRAPQWNNTEENNLHQKFTFGELYKQNITSQQLYIWSAPLDIIEQYQFYLNDVSLMRLESKLYYNCTLPRFGRYCQYSFDINQSVDDLSLNEIIYKYYEDKYDPTNLTCYIHLECHRGSKSMCLDWTEICDGTIDCHNQIDEEYCWPLETNECQDDEYRCQNGQCISNIFFHDDPDSSECLDLSDEIRIAGNKNSNAFISLSDEPTFVHEDILCPQRHIPYMIQMTSSCIQKRNQLLKDLLFFDKPNTILDDNCWLAVRCILHFFPKEDPMCLNLCSGETCLEIINKTCPDMFNVPAGTLAFGHMFFLYMKDEIKYVMRGSSPPQYVCYNDQLCNEFLSNKSLISFNTSICRGPKDFPLYFYSSSLTRNNWYNMYISPLYDQLYQCNNISYHRLEECNNLTMYKCINSSKCISKYRLCDTVYDCDYHDDENCSPINGSCSIYDLNNLFYCASMNICMSSTLLNDEIYNCLSTEYGFADDEYSELRYITKHISFPTICDGYTELIPIIIDGRNQTDETECDYWQCNNTYTRCDGFWNCWDGSDEVDCYSSPVINCPSHHHICVSPKTNQFICLPLKNASDGIIDCLGATDEPKLCRSNNYDLNELNFYCLTYLNEHCTSSWNLCYMSNCQDGSGEQFCDTSKNRTLSNGVCFKEYQTVRSNVEDFFCTRPVDSNKPQIVHFSLHRSIDSMSNIDTTVTHSSLREITTIQHQRVCHRGLPLLIWLNTAKNLTDIVCLCPPSFYGDHCQYQNQRVTLTVRFQTYSDSRQTLFSIIILLVDDSHQRLIHSYQQITYLYTKNCQTKFNMYLLYSQRPKPLTKNYSIHIDIYEKISLIYRGSLLIPLKFPFLPVHRVAIQLNIPRTSGTENTCFDDQCVHGQCVIYSYAHDRKEHSFCKCDQGWSGLYCTISYQCTCSSDSLCLGVTSTNRSICVCSVHKWGSQCLIAKTICNSNQNTTCQNDGQCIPMNDNFLHNQQFLCLCRKGFSGKLCEVEDNKIVLSFNDQIQLPQTMLVYFIRINNNSPPENGSTYKTISPNQKPITILWSYPFHIVFIQLFNDSYYLVTVQKTYNQSSIISKTIQPSDRCEHLSELLNETIVNYHLIRRIKYYHLVCQRRTPLLSCFYDQTHFCLCNDFGDHRVANCFEFNSSIRHDCFGQSSCENGAQCLQDRSNCPQTSICICPECYYGTRCQFSSSLFGLSLDGILGYHIQPHINIRSQPAIVQFSIVSTILMFTIGLLNGILLLITFKSKETRKSGSGYYLICSSITTLFTIVIFILKFIVLLQTQMTLMKNQSFLYIQCVLLDYLLRIGINVDQWLNACVAVERAITTIKGVNFNKDRSKHIAKYVIVVLILLNVSTILHDPIYRRIINDNDDEDDKRLWCIVSYPSYIQTYNLIINLFHFLTPFLMNIISSVIIIKKIAQQRTTVQTNQTYRQLLYKQIREHSHLFLSPILLILLAIPRLIISLASGCMKSTNDSWLFLCGYFISFIPLTLTFIIFVLPSKLYKNEFYKILKQYRRKLQTRIHPTS